MAYLLGIDAGGTQTACAVANNHAELARVAGPTCKLQQVGERDATEVLVRVVRQAVERSGIQLGEIASACIGIAGASLPAVTAWARHTLAELTPAPLTIVGDNVIAFRAAFPVGAGILVSSGTGSFAYGEDKRGHSARAGGYGPVISDEGSGEWIGREAVSAVMRAKDSDEKTGLLDCVFQAWNVASHQEIVSRANRLPRPNFSDLVPHIRECAQQGDARAIELMERAGDQLAKLAGRVIGRLQLSSGTIPVRGAGGVLEHTPMLQETFSNALTKFQPRAELSFHPVDPVAGALNLARAQVHREAS